MTPVLPGYPGKLYSMNLFVLSSTLFATVCLAAKGPGPSVPQHAVGDIDSLKNIILKQHPDVLAKFLVTFDHWEKEAARAFAISQVLGNCCYEQDSVSNSSNSSNLEVKKSCVMLEFGSYEELETVAAFKVDMNSLQSVISANPEWKDVDGKAYSPFGELFNDLRDIQNPASYRNIPFLYADDLRFIFAKHAKTEFAMLAIDLAILKWLVFAIKAKPQAYPFLYVNRELLMGICSLSMYPKIEAYCEKDILTVLAHLQLTAHPDNYPFSDVEWYRPSLITLVKFLIDCPVRTAVEKVLINVCSHGIHDYVNTKMLLGAEHPFIKNLENFYTTGQLAACGRHFQNQEPYKRKLYSMIISSRCNYNPGKQLVEIPYEEQVFTLIDREETLKWQEVDRTELQRSITFHNQRDCEPLLAICSQLKVPAELWKKFTICENMTMFEIALKDIKVIRMILTYGLTIVESKSFVTEQPIFEGSPFFNIFH